MADMIQVVVVDTADDTDALSGTQLDPIPFYGTLEIYSASTQNDTERSTTVADQAVEVAQRLLLRTNGAPLLEADPGLSQAVEQGQRVTVNINIVTAATVVTIARLVPD